ncbi:MAG: response regulator [Polyangiaceae bacterium]
MSATPTPRPHVVLLVDDDLRTTRRMADMLREDGFIVEVARDGAAAVARLSRPPVPDALVTELTTAHADGIAIGRFARNQRPGLPVLVVTSYPNLFNPDAFAPGPPASVFTKPVDYSALKDALRDALRPSESSEATEITSVEDLPPVPRLESNAPNALRDSLSGAETVRSLRRP